MRKGFTLPAMAVLRRTALNRFRHNLLWRHLVAMSALLLAGIGVLWSPLGTALWLLVLCIARGRWARGWPVDLALGGFVGLALVSNAIQSSVHERITTPTSVTEQWVEVERCWTGQWGDRCLLRTTSGVRWYLYWPQEAPVAVGDRALVDARLTPWAVPSNPGVSPFSVWLLRHHVAAQGRVDVVQPLPTDRAAAWVSEWREQLRQRDLPAFHWGVYQALVLGDRNGLDEDMRRRVERTQTQHLLALSGLHIGTLAIAAYGLAGLLWLIYPIGVRQDWQFLAALLTAGALLLVALPGVSLWRAFFMLLVPTMAWLLRLRLGAPEALLGIGVGMLIIDPRLVLDLGGWFSWLATIVLILLAFTSTRRPWYVTALWLQLVLSVVLVPLYALWELPFFPLSIPLNVLLIPLVTFWVLPAAFLTALHIPWADTVFIWGVEVWYFLLIHFDRFWVWFPVLSVPQALCFILSSLALFMLRLPFMAWVMWLVVLIATSWHNSQPEALVAGEFDVWVLDVGQAQAVVVDTGAGRVMFDTGNGDPARVHLQHAALRWQWWSPRRAWHAVIISHVDRDHVGGLGSVAAVLQPAHFFAGQPLDAPEHWPSTEFCNQGVEFTLNAVQFRFLRPYVGFLPQNNNDASCILLIESDQGRVLITGDATKRVEYAVLQRETIGKLDVLVSGHHGSATSTSAELLRHTQPTWVVHSAARYSRYAIPAPDVLQRVEEHGGINHCTCASGSWIYRFRTDGIVAERYGHRLLPWIRI